MNNQSVSPLESGLIAYVELCLPWNITLATRLKQIHLGWWASSEEDGQSGGWEGGERR